ncbi:MAG: hypothetical protein QXH30_03225 [Candidatus Bilamarchaeaceae archaeon]
MLPLLEKIIAVKKPAQGLPQSLLDAYEAIGKADGFQVEKVEKGLVFTGKTVKLALKVEFGNRWEFFNAITALREMQADIKVLVMSSNAKSISMEAVYTVLKKKLGEKGRWVIIDIEGKKPPMKLNFARPRPSMPPAGGCPARIRQEARPMGKTKNYGMQPEGAKPRRKRIFGRRRKGQD